MIDSVAPMVTSTPPAAESTWWPAAERVYAGGFADGEWLVSVRDETSGQWRRLAVSPEHHRPAFALGPIGSDPTRLAYALLADSLGPDVAARYARRFLETFVVGWGVRGFSITRSEIRIWLAHAARDD